MQIKHKINYKRVLIWLALGLPFVVISVFVHALEGVHDAWCIMKMDVWDIPRPKEKKTPLGYTKSDE